MKYKVIEKFTSVNGEGLRSGELTTFVRFFGCNLRCKFCDSKYTYDNAEQYEEMTEQEILDYLRSTGIKNVTLAGGEPLHQPFIKELMQLICADGFRVEVETNGAYNIAQYMDIENRPSFTLDYKTGCSGGMSKFMDLSNYALVTKHDSVKFVVGSIEDLDLMRSIVEANKLLEKTNVLVSPCYGDIEPHTIVEYMQQHNLNGYKMQIQMHKVIWDADKRGV
jgi:7-carboxy-7-deazaguanine synthase